ncbi:MAG: GNAT family N-acetyltransferase, partial [Bacteroidetes bacterium]
MSTITIRAGKREDLPQVHQLICELAAFENASDAVQTTPEELERDAWGDKPLFEYMVAERAPGEIVGMALYYKAYSTWKGPVLYLDDLVVTESCRGMGLGKRL